MARKINVAGLIVLSRWCGSVNLIVRCTVKCILKLLFTSAYGTKPVLLLERSDSECNAVFLGRDTG